MIAFPIPKVPQALAHGLVLGLFLMMAVSARPVQAHALDGTWCSGDGRRITVDGTAVITPGGGRATGAYSQFAFSFKLPDGERPAGATIWMEPKGPNAARVSTVGRDQQGPPPHGLWHRCDVTSRLGQGGGEGAMVAGVAPS